MRCVCCQISVSEEKTIVNIYKTDGDKKYILCNSCGSIIERLIDHAKTCTKIKDDSGE
jgi:hypothetical protein